MMSQTSSRDLAYVGHLSWEHQIISNHDTSFLPPEDSISMIADAYENDDFWFPASTRNSAQTIKKELVPVPIVPLPMPIPLLEKGVMCFSQMHQHQNLRYWSTTEKSGMIMLPLENIKVPIEVAKTSHLMGNRQLTLPSSKNFSSPEIGQLPLQTTVKAVSHMNQTEKPTGSQCAKPSNTKFPLDIKSACDVSTPQPCVAQPLTSYNFFFIYERERLLGTTPSREGTSWDIDHYLYSDKWNNLEKIFAFQTELLQKHWSRDRTIKRKHRKTHFRIPFQTLTRQISKNWHSLPPHVKAVFHEIAAKDHRRYTFELQQSCSKRQAQTSVECCGSKGP